MAGEENGVGYAPILIFLGIAAIAGVVFLDKGDAKPPITQVEQKPAPKSCMIGSRCKISGKYIGCPSDADFSTANGALGHGDTAGALAMMKKYNCVILNEGEPIWLVDRKNFSGRAYVRIQGTADQYWTGTQAIGEPLP